jgi:hypothetical protein
MEPMHVGKFAQRDFKSNYWPLFVCDTRETLMTLRLKAERPFNNLKLYVLFEPLRINFQAIKRFPSLLASTNLMKNNFAVIKSGVVAELRVPLTTRSSKDVLLA